jgi:hypothetical protein
MHYAQRIEENSLLHVFLPLGKYYWSWRGLIHRASDLKELCAEGNC